MKTFSSLNLFELDLYSIKDNEKFSDYMHDNEKRAFYWNLEHPKEERDRTFLYYSTPVTFTVDYFLLHFPIFFLRALPPVLPKIRSLERRTDAELTKTIKSDFFPSRRANPPVVVPLRFPLFQRCFLHDLT